LSADGTPVRIIAATLWTDFELFGATRQSAVMDDAYHAMNDFRMIQIVDGLRGGFRLLTPSDLLRLHHESKTYIAGELEKSFDGVTIVMTHHAPSGRSVTEAFADDPLAAAYASDLEALIERTQPQLWVHGHIHTSSDYVIGRTRIVCNPRGYFPSDMNPDFDPGRVIELTP
jgi:Icc-related predicted phosphoesterase